MGSVLLPAALPFFARFHKDYTRQAVKVLLLTTVILVAVFSMKEPFDADHPKRVFVIHTENVRLEPVYLLLLSHSHLSRLLRESILYTCLQLTQHPSSMTSCIESLNVFTMMGCWTELFYLSQLLLRMNIMGIGMFFIHLALCVSSHFSKTLLMDSNLSFLLLTKSLYWNQITRLPFQCHNLRGNVFKSMCSTKVRILWIVRES